MTERAGVAPPSAALTPFLLRYAIAAMVLATALMAPGVEFFLAPNSRFHTFGTSVGWERWIVTLHLVSDLLIGGAYVVISGTLIVLARRAHKDIPLLWTFVAFGTFIIACGFTHFMAALTIWVPVYWAAAGIKVLTAVASVATAVAIPPLVPKVLVLVRAAATSHEHARELIEAHGALEQRDAEMSERQARLEAIIALQEEIIGADLDVAAVMNLVIARVRSMTGAEVAGVGLVEGEDLVFAAVSQPAATGTRLGIDTSLAGWSIRNGTVMLCNDIATDSRVAHAAAASVGARSILAIPLQQAGQALAVVTASSSRVNAFTHHDVEAMQLMSMQLSAALSRAAQREAEQELVRQAKLLDLAHDAIFVRHIESAAILYWNHGAESMYGFTPEAAVGTSSHTLLHTEFPQPIEDIVATVIAHGQWDGELIHTTQDGRRIVVASRWALQRNETGVPIAVLEINRDITDRKRIEQELVTSEEQMRTIVAQAPVGIAIVSGSGVFTQMNDAYAGMVGYEPGELVGRSVSLIIPPSQAEETSRLRARLIAEEVDYRNEFELVHKDGSPVTALISSVPLPSPYGEHHRAAFLIDITAHRHQETVLSELAHYDAVTGLPNRLLLTDALNRAIAHASRQEESLAVLFIDLDGFKAVNDKLGHQHGDTLLKTVGKRLMACTRAADIVARLGGDEFVIVLPGISSQEDVETVGRKVIASLRMPLTLAGHEVRVSASVGIGMFPDHGSDTEQLLHAADLAMYRAKRAGKGSLAPSSEENLATPT